MPFHAEDAELKTQRTPENNMLFTYSSLRFLAVNPLHFLCVKLLYFYSARCYGTLLVLLCTACLQPVDFLLLIISWSLRAFVANGFVYL